MTPVVFFLIIVNVVCFGIEALFQNSVITSFALWPLGQGFAPWQLVTYAFLHDPDNLAHIAFNLYGLYLFGGDVERTLGSRRFAWLYLASVIAAGITQLIFASLYRPSVTFGASGGLFGVMLAFALLFPKRQLMLIIPPVPIRAWALVLIYGAIELGTVLYGRNTGVAHFAHLGGMIGGFLVLSLYGYKRFRRRDLQ
jgi:membrane associated rhomboid family serine protease